MAEEKKNKRITKEKIIGSLLFSFVMSYMICFFEPLQIYFTNSMDFWYDIYNLVPYCTLLLLIVFSICIISFLIPMLINEKLWKVYSALFGIAFLCTYIQGNFLAGKLPIMDGNTNPWKYFDYQRKYSIILWISVIAIYVIVLVIKKLDFLIKAQTFLVSIILCVLIITNISTCIIKNGMADKNELAVTDEHFFDISKDGTNFVIIMLDSIRGEEFNEILAEDDKYNDMFKDFTYYADTMTGYPMTLYSIYYMLSGDWFEGDESINDYRTNILLNCPLFDELENRGYSMDMYMTEMPQYDNEGFYRFRNFKHHQSHFNSFIKFAKLELRMVGLKYAPYDLKKRCLSLPDEVDKLRADDNSSEFYSQENLYLIDKINNASVKYEDGNVFKFVQVEGAHPPFDLNENFESFNGQDTNDDYKSEIKATIRVAYEYIEVYKKAGCYDNTIFILLSDHGYNTDPNTEIEDVYNPLGRQHGILLVKGLGETYDTMQYSYAPIHHGDLPEAYIRLLDGKMGQEVFDAKEGDHRDRRYLLHTGYNRDYLYEYIQSGEAGDMSTMKATGREYESIKGQVKGPK